MNLRWTVFGQGRLAGYFTLAVLAFMASFLLLPTAKMVNNVFYAMTALPALAAMVILRGQLQLREVAPLLWGALLLWCGLSAISSGGGQYAKHILYVSLFLLAVGRLLAPALFRSELFARGIFWLFLAYVLLSAIFYWITGRYALGERVLWLPSRMTGPIYSSMWIACCYALASPYWLNSRRWLEMLLGTALALFCVLFILQSRTGLVGLAAAMGLVMLWSFRAGGRFLVSLSATLALLGVVLAVVWLQFPGFKQLIIGRADSGRLDLWYIMLSEWWNCGLWQGCGVQFHTLSTINGGEAIQHPHNIFIGLGVYNGLPALLLFLSICALALRKAWHYRDPWGLYLCTALVSLNFDGNQLVGNPDELWLLVLLPLALIENPKQRHLDEVVSPGS